MINRAINSAYDITESHILKVFADYCEAESYPLTGLNKLLLTDYTIDHDAEEIEIIVTQAHTEDEHCFYVSFNNAMKVINKHLI